VHDPHARVGVDCHLAVRNSAGILRQRRKRVKEWPDPAGRLCRASSARRPRRSRGLNRALVVEPEAQSGARREKPPELVPDTRRRALNRLTAATCGRFGNRIAFGLSTQELILWMVNGSPLASWSGEPGLNGTVLIFASGRPLSTHAIAITYEHRFIVSS